MKISSRMVQLGEPQALLLRQPSFDVNIRLFKENEAYNSMIRRCLQYMNKVMLTEFEDYSRVLGISGANVAIPYRLVMVRRKKKNSLVMINPTIVGHSRKTAVKESNCGSINLDEPIKVKRYCWVTVEYYNTDGELCCDKFDEDSNTFTIQHEIDHTNGVLIIDKEV